MGSAGLGMGVAFEADQEPPCACQVALEAVGVIGVGREHPAEEDVGSRLAGVLEETLAQVHVVAPDALDDGSARADDLQKVDAGLRGGTVRATLASVRRMAGWTRGAGGRPGKREGCAGSGEGCSDRFRRASRIAMDEV